MTDLAYNAICALCFGIAVVIGCWLDRRAQQRESARVNADWIAGKREIPPRRALRFPGE